MRISVTSLVLMIRLLYIPSQILIDNEMSWLGGLFRRRPGNQIIPINGELNHLGELFAMRSNVEIHCPFPIREIYFSNDRGAYDFVSNHRNYPSNFDFDRPMTIGIKDAKDNASYYNAIIASVDPPTQSKSLIDYFTKRSIPIFYFDKFDHPEIYSSHDSNRSLLCRGREGFAGYFKQDYPKTFHFEDVFPLAPVPVRDENLSEDLLVAKSAFWSGYDTAFVGDYRSGITRPDRLQLIEHLLGADFSIKLSYGEAKQYYSPELLDSIYSSVSFNISPSGKVWDSYRHTEFAKYGRPIVLPRPDCHIVGPELTDMHHAVTYDIRISDGKLCISDLDGLVYNIRSLVADERRSSEVAAHYLHWVANHHTRRARACYILNTISRVLA
jgi:hypothetical protein